MIQQTVLACSIIAFASTANGETLLERGTYLMDGIVACGNCHTPQGPTGPVPGQEFAGQLVDKVDGVMTAWAPNITPDPQAGIGKWSDAELIKAIREGVRPDGTIIGPPMPFHWYRKMSDRDAQALVAYIRQVKPISKKTPKSEYHIPLPPSYGPPVGKVADVDSSDKMALGAYQVAIGHCLECHTPMTNKGIPDYANQLGAGGFKFNGPWGTSVSRNITPHKDGIASTTDAQLAAMIATGKRPDSSPMMPPMGYAYYRNISETDMAAIIGYLRSLPAKPNPK